ncbi:MAG: helix-turn-helix domain-containing protein [Legionellales bacterium]|nr:helix-turn-helix domain-containing protein [Legionellales bacterium]
MTEQRYNGCVASRKEYKFRIGSLKGQLLKLEQISCCYRFIWNKMLRMSLGRFNSKQYISLCDN